MSAPMRPGKSGICETDVRPIPMTPELAALVEGFRRAPVRQEGRRPSPPPETAPRVRPRPADPDDGYRPIPGSFAALVARVNGARRREDLEERAAAARERIDSRQDRERQARIAAAAAEEQARIEAMVRDADRKGA